jgi:predicted XRE-type DNA-binding protein
MMPKELADELRDAIRRSGLSQNEVARLSGVPQPRVNVFMNGGDMKLRSAGKIARILGLTLKYRRPAS